MTEPARTRRPSPRSLVQDELATSDRLRTVMEIYLALASRKQRASLSTVYRTLTKLVDSGLVEAAHLPPVGNAYRLRPEEAAGPYLVCVGCGIAATVPTVDLAPWFRAVATQQGFSDIEPRVELWGRCTGCWVITSPKVAKALADDLGIDSAKLDPIEGQSDPDADYMDIMRENLAALQAGLVCEQWPDHPAPPLGR